MAKGSTVKIQRGHTVIHLQSLSKVLAALCFDIVTCWVLCWCMRGHHQAMSHGPAMLAGEAHGIKLDRSSLSLVQAGRG